MNPAFAALIALACSALWAWSLTKAWRAREVGWPRNMLRPVRRDRHPKGFWLLMSFYGLLFLFTLLIALALSAIATGIWKT